MQRDKTTLIVLHHSVTPQVWDEAKTMANIKGSHNGTSPYHRVIGYNWQWSDPNQLEMKFHAGNYPVNLESVAVCVAGDFTKNDPKDYQKKQIAATLKEWMQRYNIKRVKIKLHREVRLSPTACPGKLDQPFISLLLQDPMTCEQELAQERSDHAETIIREQLNYNNWQIELDKRKALEIELAQEKSDHAESIAEKVKNAAERDGALEKIRQIKAIVEG